MLGLRTSPWARPEESTSICDSPSPDNSSTDDRKAKRAFALRQSTMREVDSPSFSREDAEHTGWLKGEGSEPNLHRLTDKACVRPRSATVVDRCGIQVPLSLPELQRPPPAATAVTETPRENPCLRKQHLNEWRRIHNRTWDTDLRVPVGADVGRNTRRIPFRRPKPHVHRRRLQHQPNA